MRTNENMNLDVGCPGEVANVLRNAASVFHESRSELRSAWQDKQAGWEWYRIARALEACAERIERELSRGATVRPVR